MIPGHIQCQWWCRKSGISNKFGTIVALVMYKQKLVHHDLQNILKQIKMFHKQVKRERLQLITTVSIEKYFFEGLCD